MHPLLLGTTKLALLCSQNINLWWTEDWLRLADEGRAGAVFIEAIPNIGDLITGRKIGGVPGGTLRVIIVTVADD